MVLNLWRILIIHKFHKTDTHWNSLGAFRGYQEIIRKISKIYKKDNFIPISNFKLVTKVEDGKDLASMIGMTKYFKEESIELVWLESPEAKEIKYNLPEGCRINAPITVTENKHARLGTAIVIHDSFGIMLRQFISEHFKRVVYILDGAMYTFDIALFEHEKPDIVIHEVIERHLDIPWPNPPGLEE